MSIDKKIAQLVEDSEKLQAEEITSEEVVAEDTEQIDELSKKTLTSYVKKSGKQAGVAVIDGLSAAIKGDKEGMQKNIDLIKKRKEGAERASARVDGVKKEEVETEEVDQLDATTLVPEELAVDVSEDVAALVNGEELSEEFKTKAATIFEAAVVSRVKTEVAKLEEQFESKLAEQVEEIKDGLVEKVDGYLNYVVEQWMTDNEIALENGLKVEVMESFIAGMKGLFEQHYVDVPEEKFDIVGDMQTQLEEMKAKLDEQLSANVEMKSQLDEMARTAAIEEIATEMADTDAEKFRGLAEELSYGDADTFAQKLQTIKENYFGQKQVAAKIESVVTDEPVEQLDEEVKPQVDPRMARYLQALKSSN